MSFLNLQTRKAACSELTFLQSWVEDEDQALTITLMIPGQQIERISTVDHINEDHMKLCCSCLCLVGAFLSVWEYSVFEGKERFVLDV